MAVAQERNQSTELPLAPKIGGMREEPLQRLSPRLAPEAQAVRTPGGRVRAVGGLDGSAHHHAVLFLRLLGKVERQVGGGAARAPGEVHKHGLLLRHLGDDTVQLWQAGGQAAHGKSGAASTIPQQGAASAKMSLASAVRSRYTR
eukprot:scaffold231_cov131-Isochrysis_galbana.AAC.2